MPKIKIAFINRSENPVPAYATEGSAGMDIRASLEAPVTLAPMERKLIPTGLYAEIPDGYELQIRPRSGLAVKQGITCLNTPGTIDSDYRGEIQVLLINLGQEPQTIQHGDRIAQMVPAMVTKAEIEEVLSIGQTNRGSGGFGHTGVQ